MNLLTALLIIAVLYVIGVPIAFSLGLGCALYLVLNGVAMPMIAQKLFNGIDSTTYLCVPFFLIAGDFMCRGGIGDRLIYASKLVVGRLKGGLCYVTILTGVFFAAITGTTLACVTAIGPMMIPAMEKEGYPRDFATAVTCAGSTLGPIIPPSLCLIIYASLANASVRDLYLVGIPAGFLVALCFAGLVFLRTKKKKYVASPLPKWKELDDSERKYRKKMVTESLWAFGAPIIILGGIFGGIFTPTEAAVVASVYSILVSMLVFKQIKVKELPKIFADAGKNTARIMFIIACASLFAFVLVYEMVPQTLLGYVLGFTSSKNVLLLVIMVVVLVMGMFIDPNSILLLTIPLFLPMMKMYHLDVVHMGIFMTALLCIGNLTPPFGTLLFAGAFVGGVSVQSLMKQIMPFIACMLIVTIMIMFIPQLILWII